MDDPSPLLVRDSRFREHVAPDAHPERPQRLDAIDRALEPIADRIRDAEPRAASDEEILRVHDAEHLAALQRLEGRVTQIDSDTYASPRSLEIARLAAGSAVELALRVARGEARSGFALVRPPGHHAEAGRAMGFCLLNHAAMAAQALRAVGLERIAVVDWDVHHGNGTQHALECDRDALFISLHQFPFYPGTGALSEQGSDAGLGSTVNLPLPAGSGDSEYRAAFDSVVVPVLLEFQPEMLLVSAGFDAHERDPLASMEVTREGFRAFASLLRAVAEETCGGRMLLTLEGGYDLAGLGESVRAVVEALAAPATEVGSAPMRTPLASRLVDLYREAHSAHWESLADRASA